MITYNIKLKITKEEGGWFIESENPDHFSYGKTKDEAIANYFNTLHLTIDLHMKEYNHLRHIFE